MSDYELNYTIPFAVNARLNKTNGFEGCKNFGHGCNEAGFYLETYSDEGLCG